MRFARLVSEKSPLQSKHLKAYLGSRDALYWERADRFMETFESLHEGALEHIADAYLNLCKEMLSEQIKFKKTGRYSARCAQEVNANLYSSRAAMSDRVYALAVSQFLWPNHYSLFDHFLAETSRLEGVRSYLEIGPGHGLHLIHAARILPKASFKVIDISEPALDICKRMFTAFLPGRQIAFEVGDIAARGERAESWDYIVMNEVLEHLDDPLKTLKGIRPALAPGGRLFVTTCANAPAIDHVYLYNSVEQIREHLQKGGFEILSERACPVGDYPREQWRELKVEVNYSAMLAPARSGP